jgi:hypothetical protein
MMAAVAGILAPIPPKPKAALAVATANFWKLGKLGINFYLKNINSFFF